MAIGSIEWIEISFPGNRFNGDVVPALERLVNSGTIRIIDLLVVRKNEDGTVVAHKLDALSPEEAASLEQLDGESGLLTEEDIAYAGATLPPNSTAAVLIWENLWATSLAEAVRAANGVITAHDRVPDAVIQAALQAVSSEEEPEKP